MDKTEEEQFDPLSVKLTAFEGPLDLLLHLIDKNKVDICDIPIALITGQYMEYLERMQEADLDIMSEFLVMASTLLSIKCRMILPREKNEAGEEEEDPRAELVQQLLEYKICKFMSYELKDMRLDAARSLFKPDTMPEELQDLKPPVDYDSLLKNTTLSKLSKIFKEILRRQEDKIDPIRSRFGKIEKEEVNMQEKEAEIREYAYTHGSFSFRELIEGSKSRMEVIVSFLCILELIRFGELFASQDALFDDIKISVVKSNAA